MHNVVFHLCVFVSVLSVCFPAPLCWTPCCLNQQNLKMLQSSIHCSTTLSIPSAGVCALFVFFMCFAKTFNYFVVKKYYVYCILCSKGFVEGRHIMKLRQQLQKLGYSRSFTTDEKGPLNLHICLKLLT